MGCGANLIVTLEINEYKKLARKFFFYYKSYGGKNIEEVKQLLDDICCANSINEIQQLWARHIHYCCTLDGTGPGVFPLPLGIKVSAEPAHRFRRKNLCRGRNPSFRIPRFINKQKYTLSYQRYP